MVLIDPKLNHLLFFLAHSQVGDGNNVLHDLMLGSAILGMNVNIATPKGYEPNATIMQKTKDLAAASGASVMTTTVAAEAVKGADVVVTDTWVSMGQEAEYQKRVAEFDGYQVNAELMSKANAGAVFLHCLPRHPEEVADEVFYSDASLVFPEAENRMVRPNETKYQLCLFVSIFHLPSIL